MRRKRQRVFFTARCPLGYSVSLDFKCWTNHILVYHQELFSRLNDVQTTVSSPDEIREDYKDGRYNLIYLKKFEGKDKLNPYLKVPVWVYNKNRKEGFITSAYTVLNLHGGKKIWPK